MRRQMKHIMNMDPRQMERMMQQMGNGQQPGFPARRGGKGKGKGKGRRSPWG